MTERPKWLELERVLPLPEVIQLTSLGKNTLRRYHGDKFVRLSPRRVGMRLKDVLAITRGS
jgi:predicted DNA-binding transcriptional regulator AlpA